MLAYKQTGQDGRAAVCQTDELETWVPCNIGEKESWGFRHGGVSATTLELISAGPRAVIVWWYGLCKPRQVQAGPVMSLPDPTARHLQPPQAGFDCSDCLVNPRLSTRDLQVTPCQLCRSCLICTLSPVTDRPRSSRLSSLVSTTSVTRESRSSSLCATRLVPPPQQKHSP